MPNPVSTDPTPWAELREPHIERISFTLDTIHFLFRDGRALDVPMTWAPEIGSMPPEIRAAYRIAEFDPAVFYWDQPPYTEPNDLWYSVKNWLGLPD